MTVEQQAKIAEAQINGALRILNRVVNETPRERKIRMDRLHASVFRGGQIR